MRSAISSPLVVLIVASSLAAYGDPHLMSPSPRLVTGRTVGCRFRKFCGLFSGNPADSVNVLIVAS